MTKDENLKNKETVEVVVYACGYCGQLWRNKEDADLCHMDRTCSECGTLIEKKSYYTLCDSCKIKKEEEKMQKMYNNARKITYKEYVRESPDNHLYMDGNFYSEAEDMEYSFEKEDMPEWVFGTKKVYVKLDAESIVQQFEENCELEDYYMDEQAKGEIYDFCEKWNEKHSQDVYYEDMSVVVLLEDI